MLRHAKFVERNSWTSIAVIGCSWKLNGLTSIRLEPPLEFSRAGGRILSLEGSWTCPQAQCLEEAGFQPGGTRRTSENRPSLPSKLVWPLCCALCIFLCSALAFDKAGRLAAVALSIIVLVKIDGGPAQAAIARFLEVGLGIVVALAVTLLVFPPRSAKPQINAAT